jgi:PEP-CTERM motif
MKTWTPSLITAGLVLLLPLLAQAQGIGHISTVNRSDADTSYTNGNASFEFRTQVSSTEPVLDGRVFSFSHRLAWYGGLISSSPADYATTASEVPDVGYELRFTVFDPLNIGYTLQVQGALAGALWAGTDGTSTAWSALRAFTVGARNSSDPIGSFVDLPDLGTGAAEAVVTAPRSFEERVVHSTGRARVGEFAGTLEFVFAVRADPQGLAMIAPAAAQAQSHMQFGLAPTMPALFGGLYTGPGGRPIDDLGHFLDVAVEFNRLPPVPEPGTWALLSSGLALLLWRRSRGGRQP